LFFPADTRGQPQVSKVALSLITDFAKASSKIKFLPAFPGKLKEQQSAIRPSDVRRLTSCSRMFNQWLTTARTIGSAHFGIASGAAPCKAAALRWHFPAGDFDACSLSGAGEEKLATNSALPAYL
jgi:hypothetical protein